ncbi:MULTISPECIES: hypothetical protein [Pseudomonas syringae group]|uniref:Uncharacterized protein n=1 Tax=Pseudomonas syringae group genomosp. 3 TaxID=251701 RepID=A0ABD6V7C0_9PSED|nr:MULTISPECIES: hypothetical protein [Pseudomonas syringae group]KPB92551.1 Uncharacterized protein AC506_2995 [Pseudomonas syringae pv. maculicola str. M6]KPX75299.1 Uncharacterized protein ALO84_00787 [Pseudomonas syringae pv. maculicola]POD63268.1 hypothetical protein BKM07_24010 [Pseudomonas syringae group genomosp. 3]
MAQILKPKIETIISEEVVERSFRDFSTAMCNWELWLYEHKRAMRDVETIHLMQMSVRMPNY